MVSKSMEMRLQSRSAIREAFERAGVLRRERGNDEVFDLSLGNPCAPCPAGVNEGLRQSLGLQGTSAHGYMDSAGYPELRRALARSLNVRFGIPYGLEQLVMTTGAACAINIAMQTLLDPGDEVVVFLPCYPAYHAFARTWGARVRSVDYDAQTLLPSLASLEDALGNATRLVIVNTPNNPSGLVYPLELAKEISSALERAQRRCGHEIYLLSDEPYRELVFDGAVNPCWPLLYENTLVAYSWSKSASIPGERIGYLALTPGMADEKRILRGALRSLGDLGFVNAPATSQRMALACLGEAVDLGFYERNRSTLFNGLRAAGYEAPRPNGAFYQLVRSPGMDGAALAEELCHEGVVVVAGEDFGCPDYVRASFCMEPRTIAEALPRFRRVARRLGLCP